MPSVKLGIINLYEACGLPVVSADEVSGWNSLDGGSSLEATVSVGLFGYDISCLAEACELIDFMEYNLGGSYYGYCGLIKSRRLDGLAFGVHWSIPYVSGSSFGYYCAGFRADEPG